MNHQSIRRSKPDPDLLALARRTSVQVLGRGARFTVISAIVGRVTGRAETPGRKIAVKVYSDPARLHLEVRHAALAASVGVPVPRQVSFQEGPPAVLLSAWVDGETVDRHPQAALELGRSLRRYYAARAPSTRAADPWPDEIRARLELEDERCRAMGLLRPSEAKAISRRSSA